MSVISSPAADVELTPIPRVRRDWIGGAAAAVLAVVLVVAIVGPLLAPHPPQEQDLLNTLLPPVWDTGGSWSHVLGTDQLGRDVFSRLIVGTRLPVVIAFAASFVALVLGGLLGIIAGYKGGLIASVILRCADIHMGFPALLIILLLILVFGAGPVTLLLVLGVNNWIVFTRVLTVEVRPLRQAGYVETARLTGMSTLGILRRHVLPQVGGPLTAVFLLEVPRMMLAESGLSFLGLGVSAPSVSWGLMIGDGRTIISVAYWPSVFPGVAIILTIASLYLFASWLEVRLDPLRRGHAQARRSSRRPG